MPEQPSINECGSAVCGPISRETIEEMRDWLKDCVWADYEPEEFDELSEGTIINGVERHYEGGLAAFLEAGGE